MKVLVFAGLVGLAGASSGAVPWTPVGLAGGGGMFVPAISPLDANHLMVNCDMSDAFISRDGGENWTMIHHRQLRGNTRCRPIFHPRDPDTIFAAGDWGGGLKVSRDGGTTWAAWGDLPEGVTEIALDPGAPDRMLAVVDGGEAYASADAGAHWTKTEGIRSRVAGFHFDRTSPASARVCFAGTDAGVFVSRDGGRTWSPTAGKGLPLDLIKSKDGWNSGEGAPLGPSFCGGSSTTTGECVLYFVTRTAVAGGRLTGGVFRSTDRGETWTSCMGGGINLDTKSADEWAEGPFPRYHHVLTTDTAPRTVYVACTSSGYNPPHHATVWRSDDAGATWRPVWYSDPRWKEYNCETDRTSASRGASYNGTPFGLSISPTDPNVLVMTNSGQCFITRDGGARWIASHSRRSSTSKTIAKDEAWRCNGLVVTTTWHYEIDPHDANRHFICYTDEGIARSDDGGKNWRWWGDESGSPWRNTCYELAFDPAIKGKIWGAFSDVHDIPNGNIIWGRHSSTEPGGVCLSEDEGVTWKPLHGLPLAPVVSVILDPASPASARRLWASSFEHGVYRTDDGGKTWKMCGTGLGDPGVNVRVCRLILHKDGTLFVLITAKRVNGQFLKEGVGLWRLAKGATRWKRITATVNLRWPKDFTVDPDDSRVIYLGAADITGEEQGGLYRTSDGGMSWTRILLKGPEHFGAVLHPTKKGWVYATLCEEAKESGLYLSKDGGSTWAPFLDLPFSNIMRITLDPTDASAMYVTTFGGSVWHGPIEPSSVVLP
ncbi:MAG: hypothetical protein AAB152_04090 [Candidatus Coatesbacteria bacterium]